MERSKYLLTIVLSVFIFQSIVADYKSDIYFAYINGDMSKWKNIIDQMNQQQVKTNDFLLELLNYQYGYIGWSLGNQKKQEAEKYLKLAEDNLKILEKANNNMSVVNSYKSAFLGFHIGLDKYKAPILGLKSIDCAKSAIAQDKKNPLGYIQFGNCLFYMPSLFGGSKHEALNYFKKAEELMQLNENQLKYDWNYLSLLTLIGQSYTKIKDYKLAKVYYEKVIKAEPRFLWVKNELYPDLLKMIKE
jgi:tetratricopeptide (TPR) repeat protein